MLIDKDGEKKGILSLADAIRTAEDASLDLVQVSSSDSDPIVCKILDYGKHIFSKKKSNPPAAAAPCNNLLFTAIFNLY